jgi:hypothetical protein
VLLQSENPGYAGLHSIDSQHMEPSVSFRADPAKVSDAAEHMVSACMPPCVGTLADWITCGRTVVNPDSGIMLAAMAHTSTPRPMRPINVSCCATVALQEGERAQVVTASEPPHDRLLRLRAPALSPNGSSTACDMQYIISPNIVGKDASHHGQLQNGRR